MVDGREAYERLRIWGEEPGSVALLTDIDGTLAPIVPTPDMSEISDEIRDSLQRLSRECLLVAAISGRKTEDALGLLGSKMSFTSATTVSRSCATARSR